MKKSNSVSFLPSILSSNRIIRKRKKLKLGLFMTIPDDMGFANKQIEKIDDIFKKDKENDQKFWEKNLSNNIYNLNGKTNYQILRELTQRFKLVKDNDISKVDFSKQPYLNSRQVNQIMDGNKITKRVLEKAEIERKIKDKKTYLNEFISQTKSVSLNNLKMKLIGNERIKVSQKEKDYENALKYELKSLEKDIENFDKYKIEEKQQIKNDEITLNKLIQKNKILFEENKRQLHEYKFIVEEIIRYIKLIINYKTYASFVHTLLDDENKILTINLNEYINYKNWTEKDLNKYIKKALNELNLYLKEISLNEKTLDILSDNNRLELLFQIMEDNILQVFKKREAFEAEEKRIMDENMKIYDKLMSDYENNKAKYEIYMNELEDDKKVLDKFNMDPELYDYYTEMNFLLNDICHFVVDENMKELKKSNSQLNLTNAKTEEESGFYLRRDVNKCVEILTRKQFYVQNLITEIEGYKQNDPELFRIIIGEVRINNRIKRREIEKQKNLKKELTKRENIIKKYRQNILRQKYKFREPIPYHIVQERKKHVVIYKPESTATNLLFY
jgi:hypothetical protein